MAKLVAPPLPRHWENHMDNPASTNQIAAKVQGETITLPTHFYGTWGNSSPSKDIAVYTDGSRKKSQDKEPTGSWAAILHDDLYEENWQQLHESEGRKPRMDLIKQLQIPHWYGSTPNPRSSYNTELEAITRISMILPSSWNITVWTDSKSTIDRIEALRAKEPIKIMNEPEWQLLSLYMHIETLRTKPLTLRHIKSHTKLKDPISIGNATADLKADHARLWGKPSTIPRLPIHSYLAFRNYAMEDQLPQPPLTTFKQLTVQFPTQQS
jgi:ribonuclease HI